MIFSKKYILIAIFSAAVLLCGKEAHAATNTADDGSIANSSVTAGELMQFKIGAITGVVDYACMTVFGNLDK